MRAIQPTPQLRAVIDTNSLVRAVIKPTGSVGPVLRRLQYGDYIYLYSHVTLEEVAEVLARRRIRIRYHLSDEDIRTVLQLLILRGERITPEQHFRVCRDADDDKFLDLAIAGRADMIITGDQDLLSIGEFRGIPIVGASAFLDRLAAR